MTINDGIAVTYDPCTETYTTKWGEISLPVPEVISDASGHTAAGHQMLFFLDLLEGLAEGPARCAEGVISVTTEGSRTFFHLQAQQRWTWEMFPAYWADSGPGSEGLMVGVWPD